jgi:hypothetical protein
MESGEFYGLRAHCFLAYLNSHFHALCFHIHFIVMIIFQLLSLIDFLGVVKYFNKLNYCYLHYYILLITCAILCYSNYGTVMRMTKMSSYQDPLMLSFTSNGRWFHTWLVHSEPQEADIISFTRKTNMLPLEYKFCESRVSRGNTVKDLRIILDTKIYFHLHVDYIFSEAFTLLLLTRAVTVFPFPL